MHIYTQACHARRARAPIHSVSVMSSRPPSFFPGGAWRAPATEQESIRCKLYDVCCTTPLSIYALHTVCATAGCTTVHNCHVHLHVHAQYMRRVCTPARRKAARSASKRRCATCSALYRLELNESPGSVASSACPVTRGARQYDQQSAGTHCWGVREVRKASLSLPDTPAYPAPRPQRSAVLSASEAAKSYMPVLAGLGGGGVQGRHVDVGVVGRKGAESACRVWGAWGVRLGWRGQRGCGSVGGAGGAGGAEVSRGVVCVWVHRFLSRLGTGESRVPSAYCRSASAARLLSLSFVAAAAAFSQQHL